MNPINLFKFLEKQKGRPIPLLVKLIQGLPLTPEDLIIKGDLKLKDIKITSLPDNLQIEGDLDLIDSKKTSLPKNLKIKGFLLASSFRIHTLPEGLEVGEWMNIEYTKITTLPPDLKVEANVVVEGSPLAKKSEKQIRAMLKTGYIKGQIKGAARSLFNLFENT